MAHQQERQNGYNLGGCVSYFMDFRGLLSYLEMGENYLRCHKRKCPIARVFRA